MNTLTIVRGIPGSGKSTFAEYLSMSNNAVICTADDFFVDESGEYNWNPAKIGMAHSWCKKQCENAMKSGKDVIIANTSTTESELKPYITLANKFNYRVFSVIVENRHGGTNIHSVPDETISRMKGRFSIKL